MQYTSTSLMENISKLSKDYLSNLDPVYRKNSLIHIEFVTLGSLYIGTKYFSKWPFQRILSLKKIWFNVSRSRKYLCNYIYFFFKFYHFCTYTMICTFSKKNVSTIYKSQNCLQLLFSSSIFFLILHSYMRSGWLKKIVACTYLFFSGPDSNKESISSKLHSQHLCYLILY